MSKQGGIGRVKVGSVHGRFQPPHLGHRDYILAAKQHCEFLWVGITNYERNASTTSAAAPHRHATDANPFTYLERTILLSKMLVAEGLSSLEFGFVPFPIENPALLAEFIPRDATCFTTIYDDWNREKIATLQRAGYEVRVLWERTPEEKTISGHLVRALLRKGDDRWRSMVAPAVVRDLESFAERVGN